MVDGAALAERLKLTTYPELSHGGPRQLVVVGSDVGRRWNEQARTFVRDMVRLKAHRAPRPPCTAVMLSVAVQQAIASMAFPPARAACLCGPDTGL